MTTHTFDYLPDYIMETIRTLFVETLKPGDTLLLRAPHRDMIGEFVDFSQNPNVIRGNYKVLPDRFELPDTFSLKQIIQDSLNAICPEVPKDYEEIDFEKAGGIDEGAGYWKFLDLSIQEGYIHATIKKI